LLGWCYFVDIHFNLIGEWSLEKCRVDHHRGYNARSFCWFLEHFTTFLEASAFVALSIFSEVQMDQQNFVHLTNICQVSTVVELLAGQSPSCINVEQITQHDV
jgi:hypothetical protein